VQASFKIPLVAIFALALSALSLPPARADAPCYVVNEGGLLIDGKDCAGAIVIDDSVTSIDDFAFWNNSFLTSISIPSSVLHIGENAFSGSGLTSVTIPGTVTSIGNAAFQQIFSLSSVIIQEGVTSLPAQAFYNNFNSSIANVSLPNSLTVIGDSAFYGSGLTSITIPNSVTSIGQYAFAVNRALTSITVGSGVTNIGGQAFQDNSALTSVSFLGNQPSIGANAFFMIHAGAVASVPSTAEGYVPGDDGLWNGLTVSRIVAPTITLTPNSEEKNVNAAIFGYTIGITGDTVTSFSISPATPSGLSFNTTTGLMSGIPTSVAPATIFTITARNTGGLSTATFTLTVKAVARTSDNSDEKAAAEAAAERAAAAQQEARADILINLKTGEELTLESFTKAGIPGITSANFPGFQTELRNLPEPSRSDINHILKTAYKFEIVDKIGSDRVRYLLPVVFIETNLIPAGSKNKSALVAAVRRLPLAKRDSYVNIKVAIDEEIARIQARKDRLASVIARKSQLSLGSTQPQSLGFRLVAFYFSDVTALVHNYAPVVTRA